MTRAIAWQLNSDGFVTGASVHDGTIVKACYEEGTFRIRIAGTTGALSEFVFGRVTKFRANFTNGPIVDSVFAWKVGQAPEFSPHAEDNPWRQLAWPAPDHDLPGFVARLSSSNPNSFLVQISCSYGGDTALICRDIDVYDVS